MLVWADPPELAGDAGVNFEILRKTDVPIVFFGTQPGAMPTSSWACGEHGREDVAMPPDLASELAGAAWIVDALLGTGARGEPRPPLDRVINQLNAAAAPILAIDLPSGLDCDSGQAAGHTIRAAHTCTFVARKIGFATAGAAAYTGEIHVLDIGAPRETDSGSAGD